MRTLDLPGGPKFAIHERYGVRHYWTVDLDARTISQYAWHDGRFGVPTVLRAGDTLTSPLFPNLARPVGQIFAALGLRYPDPTIQDGVLAMASRRPSPPVHRR